MNKVIHHKTDFEGMRKAGHLAASTLDMLVDVVKPGITTEEIDNKAFEFINNNGGLIGPLFYKGFPKSICTSINHVICHGIPSSRILESGDIVNIDVTVILDGWHGDTSRMFYVGEVSIKAKKLVESTYQAMMEAIKILNKNIHLGDIGESIQSYVEKKGFSVVRDFCGHGIGEKFHKEPNILHYGEKGKGEKLEVGMIFTIEPMINEGKYETKLLNDGWTAVTKDKNLSAQFEHTVGITNDGYEIFTESKKGLNFPPYKS